MFDKKIKKHLDIGNMRWYNKRVKGRRTLRSHRAARASIGIIKHLLYGGTFVRSVSALFYCFIIFKVGC